MRTEHRFLREVGNTAALTVSHLHSSYLSERELANDRTEDNDGMGMYLR